MKKWLMFSVCLGAVMVVHADLEVTNAVFDGLSTTSASVTVRLDQRTSFGGALARGTVQVGAPSGEQVTTRDTTLEANGWQRLTNGDQEAYIAIQNSDDIVIEGGRLTTDTVWTSNKVHLVRHWVTVPEGVTLSFEPNTIVKFTEASGIKVEDGGTLDLRTSAILTQDLDDARGGDTDLRARANRRQDVQIYVMPNGSLLDEGLAETRYINVSTFGTISVNDVLVVEQEGSALITFTYSGTTPSVFTCDYETSDGTAVAGDDYTPASGTMNWVAGDEESKRIQIPITQDAVVEARESFKLKITAVRGMNIANDEVDVKIVDSPLRFPGANAGATSASSARFDQREGVGGHLTFGTEKVGSVSGASVETWDTTAVADGWVEKTSEGESAQLLVRNDPTVVVEEGRLAEDAVWSNDVVHVVRNWVTIPDGRTLTVLPGACVKFAEDTGIRVEDGGTLVANGESTNRVVFTMLADDTAGLPGAAQDTDCRDESAVRNGAQIYAQAGGSVVDNGWLETRNINFSTFGSVSVADADALEQTGCVYVPVTIDTSRSTAFEIDWVAVDGSAAFSNDYQLASGTLHWSGSGDGTKYIEIPIVEDLLDEGRETFQVQLVAARGVNLSRETATVTIVDSTLKVKDENFAEATSAGVRFEQRTGFGGHLAHGVEHVGSVSGTVTRVWNTAEEEDGWHDLTEGTNVFAAATLNDELLAVEGGRLASDTIWSNDLVHVVRNWVTVPNGVTLTVTAGTVVKFTEETGIRVEDGGRLEVVGEAERMVVFTHATDDTVGGDLDGEESTPEWTNNVAIYRMPNATVSENGYLETRRMTVNAYDGSVYVQDARAIEVIGTTYVPVTVSGTRTQAFSIDWVAVDGTAKFGEDYTLASGTLSWTGVGEGTKFITIPLVMDSVYEPGESFTIKIVGVRGMNIGREQATVGIVDSELMFNGEDVAAGTSTPVRLDMRTTFGGRLAHGAESVGSISGNVVRVWQTAEESDGWHDLVEDTNTIAIATINDPGISVEGGRLSGNTVWSNDVLHLVRHWVTVPSGVTLTVTTNAVVKFTPSTGIRVEDGGVLNVVGASDGRVVFTVVDDDSVAGDTDFTEGSATWLGAQVYKMASGTVADNGWLEVRKMSVSSWGGVTLLHAQAIERDGIAYIPVTLSGTRNAQFCVDWEIVPGTATAGNDYTTSSGTLFWTGTSEGMKYIEVPLVADNIPEGNEAFTIRLRGACGMNVSGESSTVSIIDEVVQPIGPYAAAASEPVRFDQRTSLGGRLAHGVEKVGSVSGETARTWNTALEADGWKTVASEGSETEVLARNDAAYAVEGGRLAGDTIWTQDQVHLVRHWVTVPNGVTLTITEGTVVKFTEATGIRVEDGGTLNVVGTFANRVVFTMAEDDTTGGDADLLDVAAAKQNVQIYKFANGTFNDNGFLELRNMTATSWGSANVLAAQTHEGKGIVYVPITVSGTRNAAFSVFWRAVDGTAKFGEDFTLASGRLEWSGTSEGMKYVTIPVVSDDIPEGHEHFTLQLTGGCGINLGTESGDVEIFDSAEFSKTATSGTVGLDNRTNLAARLVRGVVNLPFADWQTGDTATASVRISATPLFAETNDATSVALFACAAPTNGMFAWNSAGLTNGWWHLTHEELDADGEVLATETADLDVQQSVIVHEGAMTTNEVWAGNGLTHYLSEGWTVPEYLHLDIESGAVVKSELGKRITIEDNALLTADGTEAQPIVFTSVRDDEHGGDLDGGIYAAPELGDWGGFTLYGTNVWAMSWTKIFYASADGMTSLDLAALDHLELDESWFGVNFMNSGSSTNTLSLYQADGEATFGGSISGAVNLEKTGAGTINLSNRLENAGVTCVANGKLRLANSNGIAKGDDGTVYPIEVTTQLWNQVFLAHRWSFNTNFVDSVGGQDATPYGTSLPSFTADGKAVRLAGGKRGTSWINLGADVLSCGEPVTLEIWATHNQAQKWSRVFDFGTGESECMLLTWSVNTMTTSEALGIHPTMTDIQGAMGGFALGTQWHIAVVFQPTEDGRIMCTYYKQNAATGATVAKRAFTLNAGWTLASIKRANCWLGHSFYAADYDASATYDEVRVWNAALSEAQLTANAVSGPDVVPDIRKHLASDNTYAIASGATLDLNGNLLTFAAMTGSGTVTNGAVMAGSKIDSGLTLTDVEVVGEGEVIGDDTVTPDAAFWAAHPSILAAAGGDPEVAKLMQSPGSDGKGKFKSNGEPMYVWEDYVAGTDPEDETDFLTVRIRFEGDLPVVTWYPALNDTATEQGVKVGKRLYRIWGKTSLDDPKAQWRELDDGEETDYKFFKVTVEMP